MEPNPEILGAARREIDETDRELIRLLARRFDAVRMVAGVKAGLAHLHADMALAEPMPPLVRWPRAEAQALGAALDAARS